MCRIVSRYLLLLSCDSLNRFYLPNSKLLWLYFQSSLFLTTFDSSVFRNYVFNAFRFLTTALYVLQSSIVLSYISIRNFRRFFYPIRRINNLILVHTKNLLYMLTSILLDKNGSRFCGRHHTHPRPEAFSFYLFENFNFFSSLKGKS